MHTHGQCHCGAVAFEAEVDRSRVGVCHCTDCQTFSGGAFRTGALVREADLQRIRGEPVLYEKTAASGAIRRLAFCGACGTHLWGESGAAGSRVYSVRVGVLRERRELSPTIQLWCDSALPWLGALADVPRREQQ